MVTTNLSIIAIPGKVHSFLAKDLADTDEPLYPPSRCSVDQDQLSESDNISFGNTTTTRIGQSFVSSVITEICATRWYLFKVGSPSDAIQCDLYEDNSGEPGAHITTASNTITGTMLETTKELHSFLFETGNDLTQRTTYWLVLSRTGSQNAANYFCARAYGV